MSVMSSFNKEGRRQKTEMPSHDNLRILILMRKEKVHCSLLAEIVDNQEKATQANTVATIDGEDSVYCSGATLGL